MLGGKENGHWVTHTVKDIVEKTTILSRGLILKGIQKGDRIAIMSGNRPEWTICDFGCNQIGAAIVPLYPTLSDQDLAHILLDSEVKLVFVSNGLLYSRVKQALLSCAMEREVFVFDKVPGLPNVTELLDLGQQEYIDLHPYQSAIHQDDLLTLIYTSGTTGKPKGVCLSHRNVLTNVSDCSKLLPSDFKKALSFLPLCHIFERMVVYLYLNKKIEIFFAESHENIVADMNDVKPDGFTTVPRVLEKVYDRIVAKGKEQTGIKKLLFFWALELGLRYQEPSKNSIWYRVQLTIARKLIFSKWKKALGGEVKLIISGGAALQVRLARTFWAAGIRVIEGYGLTETSPVIAVNEPNAQGIRFGTVGRVLSSVHVKIAADNEILCKGPSVFTSYYHHPEATSEAIDEDGYFRTGDIGELSYDGFLTITDRKKEMFKTAGGKYISPQILENKMMESTFIAQIMVVGENQRFPAALIVPAMEVLEQWCVHKNIPIDNRATLLQHPEVLDKFNREIDRLNETFGQWERIKKFCLIPHEWTIQKGELTPKLSLRRKIIQANHQQEIRSFYPNN